MSSRTPRLLFAAAFVTLSLAAVGGCTSILGSFEVDPSLGSEAGAEGGAEGLGKACTTAAECPSGFCTDGVCCESKCDGVCEACNLAEKGKCLPHAAGTDPDKECKPTVRPDAGPPPEPVEAGADADVSDDGGDGGGVTINLPEGFTQDDNACAPSCNGQRACGYPGVEKNCGTKFCNTKESAGQFACDGKGLCDVSLSTCDAYTCKGDACGASCAQPEDCLDTHFCNAQGKCQARLGNGVECGLSTQCQSGFCVDGVCCNSECNTTGAQCKAPGKVGQCTCPQCPNGTCRLFYKDGDGDGFGDKDGTLPGATNNGTAVIGCVGQAPPAGFKDKADDCDDGDANVFPGQTQWFTTASNGKGTFDYNCNGAVDKETLEYPGAACRFCGPPKTCAEQTSCSTLNESASLTCQFGRSRCGLNLCDACGRNAKGAVLDKGFTTTVQCGAIGTKTDCGTCTTRGGGVVGTTTSSVQQRCH